MSDPDLPTIRFFPDWGHLWSLWDSEAGGAVVPSAYGVSEVLTFLLSLWTQHWSENFDPFTEGWTSEEARRRSSLLGDEILQRLRAELGSRAHVVDGRQANER